MSDWIDSARRQLVLALLSTVLLSSNFSDAADWPQFRGPSGSAVDPSIDKLPAEIGPGKNLIWKAPLPPGHSSPIVYGDKIFLTAVRNEKLLTIALDRKSGRALWEAESPYEKLETIH